MNLHGAGRIVLAGLIPALSPAAQGWISVGVTGGIPVTNAFADRTFVYPVETISDRFGTTTVISESIRGYSGSKNFLLGPTLEIRLRRRFSVEADALYRPLNLKSVNTVTISFSAPGLGSTLSSSSSLAFSNQTPSWEFPILAKYRLPLGRIHPHIEAGPSFRATSGSLAEHISSIGATVGVGLHLAAGPLRIGPELRYSYWGADGAYTTPFHAVSERNQLELLLQVMTASRNSSTVRMHVRAWKDYFAIGVKGGLPFTDAFVNDVVGMVRSPFAGCGNFSCAIESLQTTRASRNYLLGPTLEFYLPHHLSVEGDGLYAPVSQVQLALPGVLLGYPVLSSTASSWQFPLLGKYTFAERPLRPYLEAGPSFRDISAQLDHYLSNSGVTAGVGVDASLWKLHVAPEIRYVHWGKDSPNADLVYASRRNQAQFLIGIAY